MAKQLNVNLSVSADTAHAKQQIAELAAALQKVSASPITFGDSGAAELKKASEAAVELQRHLQQAVDVNTGKLDLSRFQTSLAKSGKSLNSLQQTLMSAGTEGQQAFLKLASAIASAEAPATRVNKKLAEMGTVLKNTIKWQISSSLIHSFMGTLQTAVGYAEDLNSSLNNIRVVTGKSTEEMASFASEANKAAKGLNTSTLDYTKASLIYYQQGIRDQAEIAERTAVTIKLANVSRQSAEDVSNQMTAIWNNFDDGSKSLEYYADVITALGASTASSSEEIATGLEKFAAVAQTVGLSYEYATSALATITATTRQSADVVGTALKTLFARIQDLELGKTLEDGTTLGKYSAALETVGVNIKNINGEVKDMDTILDELGAKWNTISKDQQIALAQTVAGTRQYTQLMALMSNWDFMKENLETVEDAEGTLQEQADIYAQSWEAASNRVQNSLEKIYSSLVDDKVAVGFLNVIDKILVGIGGLVEGLGGMKGIIFTIGSYVTTHFAKEMPTILSTITANLVNMTSAGEKAAIAMQRTSADSLMNQFHTHGQNLEFDTQVEGIAKVAQMNAKLIQNQKNLSVEEKAYAEIQIQNVKLGYEMAATLAKEAQALNEKTKALQENANVAMTKNTINILDQNIEESDTEVLDLNEKLDSLLERRLNLTQQIAEAQKNGESTSNLQKSLNGVDNQIQRIQNRITQVPDGAKKTETALKDLFTRTTGDAKKAEAETTRLMNALREKNAGNAIKEVNKEVQKLIPEYKAAEEAVGAWKEKADALGSVNGKSLTESQEQIDEYKQKVNELINSVPADNPLRQNIEATLNTIKQGQDATGAIDTIKQDLTALFNDGTISTQADALREILLALVPPEVAEQIRSLGQAARESGAGMAGLKESTDGIGPKMEEFAEHSRHASEVLMQLSSAFMSFQSLLNSATRIVDVFNDKDASGLEKVSAVLGGLISLLMAYNSISKITTGLQASLIKAHKANTVAQTAETGATAANTPVAAANAAVWWSHPIVAIIAAAVMVAVAAFFALSGALKSNTDNLKTNAEAYQENYDKTQAQIEANRSLIDSMQELLDQYKTDKSKKEELDEVTRKLAEAYNLEGAALAALTGDEDTYSKLLDQAIEHQNQELIDAEESARKNKEAQGGYLTGLASSGNGFTENGTWDYTQFVGGGADDARIREFLAEQYFDNPYIWTASNKAGWDIGNQFTGVWYDSSDADSVVAYYNTLLDMRQKLGNSDLSLKNSGIYKEIETEIERLKDQVDAYTQASAAFAEVEASAAIAKAVQNKDIKSYSDYEAQKKDVIDALMKEGQTEESAIKAWNSAAKNSLDPVINKYQQLDSVLEDIFSLYNIADNKKQDIANLFEDSMFGENPQYSTQALAMVDWSQMNELDHMQQPQLEGEALIADYYLEAKDAALQAATAIESVTSAQEKFQKISSSGLTADELKTFEKDSGLEWGKDDIISYSDFLLKTKEEQTKYLNELNQKARQSFIDETQDAITWSEILLDSYNDDLQKAIARGDTATADHLRSSIADLQTEIDTKKQDLSIYLTLDKKEFLDQLNTALSIKYEIGATLTIDTVTALKNLGVDISKYLVPNNDGTYTLVISDVEVKAGIREAIFDKFTPLSNIAAQKNEDWYNGLLENNVRANGETIEYSQAAKDAMRAAIDNGEVYTTASILDGSDKQLWDAHIAANDAVNYDDTTGVDFQKNLLESFGETYNANDLDATNEALQRVRASLVEMKDSALANVITLSDLQALNESGIITYEENASALVNLATQYDNCQRELSVYNQALQTGTEEQIKAAQAELEAAISAGEAAKAYGLDPNELEDLTDIFGDYNDELSQGEGMLESNAEAAKDAAVRYARLNKAVEDIYDNYDDYKEALEDVQKAQTVQDKILASNSKNCIALKKSLAGLLDTSEDFIDSNFLDALDPKDLEKAAMGDEQAIGRIRDAFIDAQAAAAGLDMTQYSDQIQAFKDALNNLDEGAVIDIDDWPFLQKLIESQLAAGATSTDIQSLLSGFDIDADVKPFVGSMDELARAAADAANSTQQSGDAIVGNMSFDAQTNTVTAKSVDRQEDVGFTENYYPTTHTVWDEVLEEGNTEPKLVQQRVTSWQKTVTANPVTEEAEKEQTVTGVKISNAHKSAGGGVSSSNKTNISPGSGGKKGGGGGGGGGKSAKHTAKHTNAGTYRYTRVENAVDSLSGQYDRLNKARERAWGVDKLDIMDSEVKKMEELSDAYKDYLKEVAGTNWNALHKKIQEGSGITEADIQASGGYLNEDYNTIMNGKTLTIVVDTDSEGNQTTKDFTMAGLTDLLGKYGITGLDFDDYGRINNIDEINTAFASWYAEQEGEWNSKGGTWQESAEGKNWWAEVEEIKKAFPELFELYSEDIEKLVANSDALQENTYAIQDLKFDQLNEELDLWLDSVQRASKHLEYAAKILGDNFYKIAEVMKTLYNPNGGSQYQTYLNTAEDYKLYYEEAKAMYAAGEISQAEFIEAAKKAQEGIYGVIDSLLDMNAQMREYYGKALDGAIEELEKLTKQMDHQVDVMDHLKNVLSLLNKETDYKSLSTLLKGTVAMRKNRLDVSTKEYEMFNQQRIKAEERYQQLLKEGLTEGTAEYKAAVLDKIVEQTAEAESKMYEDAEAYLEAINELYTNTINDIMAKQEKMLSGGFGYDFLTETMERANSIQDEYLTKTNQIYETNTLLHKLSQDIDKTDSIAAKIKLKNFSSEIEAMQKQERLSQNDLEIAKARYEVLLAEIALEEAKNAKSTVRLQRDNEGNYGYVYTADQDKVDDAEQNLADKRNDLYNLVLAQTNEYGQKIVQLEKERDDALMALAEEYRGAEGGRYEEYLQKKEALTNQYNELLYAAYDSYDKGIMWLNRTAATDYREAWVTEYENVIDKGRDYETQTKDVISQIESAMKEYEDQAKIVIDNIYLGVDNLEKKTSDLVTVNENLAKELEDRLIPKVQTEIEQVDLATEAWARHYEQIMANIQGLMNYNAAINDAINAEAYDKNTNYAQLMYDYLNKTGAYKDYNYGGKEPSMDDAEYRKLQRQREAKINGENMSVDAYGYRGNEINNVLSYYQSQGLESYGPYFARAFDEWAADNGLNASGQAKITPEDYQAGMKAINENTEAQQDSATKIEESAKAIGEAVKTVDESLKIATEAQIQALQENSSLIQSSAVMIADSVREAAYAISSAASSIGSFGGGKPVSAATGTYTGEWGSEGKLAILHEKELVLNAADTQNLLETVDLVRELTRIIDLRAASSALISGLASPVYQGGEQTLEQEVIIHAEFPNATNHSEIEEAFNSLINRASQYANRY